jgi:hypothetical protein
MFHFRKYSCNYLPLAEMTLIFWVTIYYCYNVSHFSNFQILTFISPSFFSNCIWSLSLVLCYTKIKSINCLWCLMQQYFGYVVVVSFIGGGNQSTRIKPPSCRKSLTNFITYTSPWAGFELTTLVKGLKVVF